MLYYLMERKIKDIKFTLIKEASGNLDQSESIREWEGSKP
jgi:hypothetical protein